MDDNKKELENEYGSVVYDGIKYILTQQAYVDQDISGAPIYEAQAIRADDIPDEYDTVDAYMVTWYVPDSTIEYWNKCQESGDYIDEGDACDWDNPDSVDKCGEYSF